MAISGPLVCHRGDKMKITLVCNPQDFEKVSLEKVSEVHVPKGHTYLLPNDMDMTTVRCLEIKIKKLVASNKNRLNGIIYWKNKYEQK